MDNIEIFDFYFDDNSPDEILKEEIDQDAIFRTPTAGKIVLDRLNNVDEMYKMIAHILDISENFKLGSNKRIGSLPKSYCYGKQDGIVSKDGKTWWRLDWDDNHGAHVNFKNISTGKRDKAVNILIPVTMSHKQYMRLIDSWDRKDSSQPRRQKALHMIDNNGNIQLLKGSSFNEK